MPYLVTLLKLVLKKNAQLFESAAKMALSNQKIKIFCKDLKSYFKLAQPLTHCLFLYYEVLTLKKNLSIGKLLKNHHE